MERPADVVVVGAGIMGLASARALAQFGREVVCLEQFRIGHSRGSSHGTSRIFRLAYEDREYVHLAQEALPLWRALEAETGEHLLETTGSLDVGGDLGGFQKALAEAGVEADMLEAAELRRRYPDLHLGDSQALFHREGGILRADRAARALAASARAHGAKLVEEAPVLAIRSDDGGLLIETPHGSRRAGAAVVAAGAWAPRLVDLPVMVTRETVVHFRIADPNGLPTLIDHDELQVPIRLSGQATYALPSPGIGLKAGVHRSGNEAEPDDDGGSDPAVVEAVSAWAKERYKLADPQPALVETCLYTSTADQGFVVERRDRVVVCSACSGHGFKFAPALGRRVAGLTEQALAD